MTQNLDIVSEFLSNILWEIRDKEVALNVYCATVRAHFL